MKIKKFIKRTAVILCGGKGTRLGLIGKKLPKSLVKIHNKEILWFIIKVLQKNSFNHFILPIGYKGNQIRKYIKGNNSFRNVDIELVKTGKDTSIAKRIYRIKNSIVSKDFALLNGDALFDFNLKKIFDKQQKLKLDATFMGCSTKLPYGIILKKNNKVINFIRDAQFNSIKQKNNKKFTGYVYSGISILKKKLLEKNFQNFNNFETSFYPKIIKKNKTSFEEINGFWHSIDNYKDINDVNDKVNIIKYKIVKKLKKRII